MQRETKIGNIPFKDKRKSRKRKEKIMIFKRKSDPVRDLVTEKH